MAKIRKEWPKTLEGLDQRFKDRLVDVAKGKLPAWYVSLCGGELATATDVVKAISEK